MHSSELTAVLEKIKFFVLDMDGTIYLGDRLFDYSKKFLSAISAKNIDHCFFTNNSSKNRQAYIEKLRKMDIHVEPSKVLLSNDVIIKWLRENRLNERAYVVGTSYLLEDFQNAGIELDDRNPDYVVLGFDTSLTYEKLALACSFIRRGKSVYGVNSDWNCPTEDGFIPDCGSIAALVAASTGVQCEFFGKPSKHTLKYILEHTGCKPSQLAIVGDRLYTDIKTAEGSDVTSILVLSGETVRADLEGSDIQPDIVVENIAVLADALNEMD